MLGFLKKFNDCFTFNLQVALVTFSGIRPPADPKGPPLYYFEISIFGWLILKFSEGATAPICTNFEGNRASKNAIFRSKFSKKCLKTLIWACFSRILPAAQKFWPKLSSAIVVWKSSENSIWCLPIFWKSFPPPLEKFLDPRLGSAHSWNNKGDGYISS